MLNISLRSIFLSHCQVIKLIKGKHISKICVAFLFHEKPNLQSDYRFLDINHVWFNCVWCGNYWFAAILGNKESYNFCRWPFYHLRVEVVHTTQKVRCDSGNQIANLFGTYYTYNDILISQCQFCAEGVQTMLWGSRTRGNPLSFTGP